MLEVNLLNSMASKFARRGGFLSIRHSTPRNLRSRRPTFRNSALIHQLHSQCTFKAQKRTISISHQRLANTEESYDPRQQDRESDEVDVCIVGGGPAGLAAAIRLKQLANEAGNDEFRVLLLEKSGELGDHIVSGNVMEPVALKIDSHR
jgi:electron-transferring-flavoprotein dehydrogenase